MTDKAPKERHCAKCSATFAGDLQKCPECGTWVRKFTLRTAAGTLVGNRPEDKTVRKTAAATGGSAVFVYMVQLALSTYQGEAKAWREVTQTQGQATATALTKVAESNQAMREAFVELTTYLRATVPEVTAQAEASGAKALRPAPFVEAQPSPPSRPPGRRR